MPDQYGFDHLPNWGIVSVRCIDCGAGGSPVTWTEKMREKHQRAHLREQEARRERERKANLADARRALQQKRLENALAYGEEN